MSKRIAALSILTTFALVLGYIERFIPIDSAVPGVKLGLSNIVILFALYTLNKKDAFMLLVLKVVLSGLLFAGVFGMIYSFAGGLLALISMILAMKLDKISVVGISVTGAIFHNVGQVLIAAAIITNLKISLMLPVLLLSAVITGVLTGIISRLVLAALEKNKLVSLNKKI